MLFNIPSLRLAATVLAFASLSACSKKKDDAPAPTNPEGMSWTVDGGNVTAATAVSQTSGSDITLAGGTGTTGASSGIFLEVPKTAGTYTLSSTSNSSASYQVTPASGSTQSYEATTGTIVVSGITATNITGTYTFTGTDVNGTTSKTISNGKFNVKL